ncbi:hypothetical protein KDH_69560 [Dictyobacter sp. S3.2.2.5]|uniref:NmrA-like domain-containing protein n=1 Tax=Dictyobacter halimunensis TaxID=3026934 RepID=A0ABQ6G697_9CHLR|nr:hypothetical protein KDH_69560 [Dictyobacter sp. S3.2.2.5]
MSNIQNRHILVLGATGQQGGAVARHLLAAGWKVRALVRDLNKDAAQDLKRQGVELVQGDLNQLVSLRTAMANVYGVFCALSSTEAGVEVEERQGKAVADVAKEAGVSHFVYSSVGGAERESGIPHFESKWHVENYLHERGLPVTILRPAFFMDNFRSFVSEEADKTLSIKIALRPETVLQMIAVDDIGAFAALAFEQKTAFLDKEIEIAGDELTPVQITEVFQRVLGKPLRFIEVPVEQMLRVNFDNGKMFAWFNEAGYRADIATLRQLYPPLKTLEMWLKDSNAFPLPA